jgi:hypothetical protein
MPVICARVRKALFVLWKWFGLGEIGSAGACNAKSPASCPQKIAIKKPAKPVIRLAGVVLFWVILNQNSLLGAA